MRICVVSPLYHPSLGGLGRQAQLLSERLAEEGVVSFVIARRMHGIPQAEFKADLKVYRAWSIRPDVINFETVKLKNIFISLTFSLSCAVLLLRKRREYDIVHFHGASLPLLINILLLKGLRKKIVAKVAAAKVGTEAGSLRGRYAGLGNILARLLRNVDAFIATTGEIEKGLLRDGINPSKIHRISNFIDFSSLSMAGVHRRSETKKDLGTKDVRQVAFSGRFVERKGIAFLLQAWAELHRDFPNARLILFGDGPLLSAMKNLARELDIGGSVEFAGHVDRIIEYLSRADIYVLPSLQEGMPNALLEAMACGLPPVATRIGGVEDIIINGENGILVNPADAISLAEGIRRLLTDDMLVSTIAAKAQQTIIDFYSIENTVPRYLALYKSLLIAHPGSG